MLEQLQRGCCCSWRDASVTALAVCLLGFLVRRYFKRTPPVVSTRDTTRGHRWCHTSVFSQPSYCSVCESLLMTSHGAFCEACGVCACPGCVRPADQQFVCKVISSSETTLKHHWVKGNLPFDSECEVCEKSCGDEPELKDFRCCLCQRTVHSECKHYMAEVCDLGRFAQFIVPPNCVTVRPTRIVRRSLARRLVVSHVTQPSGGDLDKHWTPLIVIGNRRAGNNDGEQVLMAFRRFLNPAQVVDLAEHQPEDGLGWCQLVDSQRCRVLVAGGDGTVDWVLNAIDHLSLSPPPAVGILPLGTGNDLSRVLGSGEAHTEVNPELVMGRLRRASVVNVDRWMVRLDPLRGLKLPGSTVVMTNYLSLGVDALVTLNFHKTRESPLYLWTSRIFNKFIYFCYGTKDVLERECMHLERKLTLYMDGRMVELPEVEAVVVQNIATWGAGVRPWQLGQGAGDKGTQRMDDGLLEVFCVYSSFHIAQLQVGMSEPLRLGQAKHVQIDLRSKVPMQMDGEPWEQGPCTIRISHHNQARMLQMI